MKRLSIYFLAFLTFWMSTWMVTDIHDLSTNNADQLHQAFSAEHEHTESHLTVAEEHNHNSHCGVCSYDHGGHIGQTIAASSFVVENIFLQSPINSSQYSSFWYSRNTLPSFRPPIV